MGKNTRSSSPSALCVQNEPAKGGNGETRESSKENKSLRFSRFLSFSLSSSSLSSSFSLSLSLSCLCCYPFGASLTCLQQRGMVGSIAMLLLFLPCAIVSGRCVCDEGENMRKSTTITTITTNGTGRASTPALLVYCACGKRERARGDK